MWQLIAFIGFFGPAVGGTITLRSAILREYFGRNAFGSIQGSITTVMTIGGIIGPAYAGWVHDIQGSYKLAWVTLAGAILAVLPMSLAIKKGS